jgi:hypothetical protein
VIVVVIAVMIAAMIVVIAEVGECGIVAAAEAFAVFAAIVS